MSATNGIRHQERVEARHDFGGYNAAAHRLRVAVQADHCVKWLEAQGLQVLFVAYTHPAPRLTARALPPRIYIRPGALCDLIEGAVQVYERNSQCERRYKMALRLGCEVRWAVEESEVAA